MKIIGIGRGFYIWRGEGGVSCPQAPVVARKELCATEITRIENDIHFNLIIALK